MRRVLPWRALLLTALAVAWGIAIGCTSFSNDEQSSPDAGADATPDGATADSAVDATSPAARFCKVGDAASATFCADFDEGPLDAGFPFVFLDHGSLATTASDRSPPNALLATIDPLDTPRDAGGGDGAPSAVAALTNTLGRGMATSATIELDVRIEELPEAGAGAFGTIAAVGFDVNTQSAALAFGDGQLLFVITDPALPTATLLPVERPSPPNGWFHVTLDVSFTGSKSTASFNGVQVATTPTGIKNLTGLGVFVDVGVGVTGTSGSIRIAYDNLTVTLH
jgi:hypothetical protein